MKSEAVNITVCGIREVFCKYGAINSEMAIECKNSEAKELLGNVYIKETKKKATHKIINGSIKPVE